jgi:hypothetical protein
MTNERECGMYTGGTPEAIKFIEKYKKTGHVVDFYSDEYILKRQKNNCLISQRLLKTLDVQHGSSFRNHLLIIYIGDGNSEMLQTLSSLYEPIHRYFNLQSDGAGSVVNPDFLLLNLSTKEILCVGIGWKNRGFNFELHNYLAKYTSPEAPYKLKHLNSSQISTECSDAFFELDHWNISKKIIAVMNQLGDSYEKDSKRGVLNAIKYLSCISPIDDIWEMSNNQ